MEEIEQAKSALEDLDDSIPPCEWSLPGTCFKYQPDNTPMGEMSVDIIQKFNDHGIKYVLHCGTALGAFRHGGFIEGDADMDIIFLGCENLQFFEDISTC